MSTATIARPVADLDTVRIPMSVVDLPSFRRWATSDDFPERGRYAYLNGSLWVDLMPEQLDTHNNVKAECTAVLHGLLKRDRRGRYYTDGALVTNESADLSTEPDGTIVLFDSLRCGRVKRVPGRTEGFIELQGSPDVVIEVVSTTSLRKDTVVLRELYWLAEIAEYWLVDARGDRLDFDILRRGRTGYVATRKQAGWVRSTVLGRSFRLTRQTDEVGDVEYRLSVR